MAGSEEKKDGNNGANKDIFFIINKTFSTKFLNHFLYHFGQKIKNVYKEALRMSK